VTQCNLKVLLGLLLAAGPAASAQTLLDTSAAISIQNTLGQPVGPSGIPALPLPRVPAAAPAVAAPANAPATGSGVVAPASSLPPLTPLTPAQQAALTRARDALGTGQLPQARALFEALIAQNYAQPEPHFGLGLTLLSQGDLGGATFEFTQLAALAPGRFEAPYNLGVIAGRQGRHADALRLYGEAAALARGKAGPATERQVLEAWAAEQTRARDFAGLSATLTQVVALDPNDVDAAFRLAQAQVLAGQGVAALPGVYAVLQRQPARVDAALLLADIYVGQGLPGRAARELGAAAAGVTRGGDRARLLLRQADVLVAAGDPRGAVLAAQEATRQDPRNAAAFARLGELRALRDDRPGALTAYQKAAHLAPRNPEYLTALAAVRLALGQTAGARLNAAMALRLKPGAPVLARAQFVQGVAAYRQRQYAQARSALRASAATQPSAEAYLWLGLSAYAMKDYAGAAGALGTSVKLDPTPTARQNLASALLAAARYPEAEAVLRGLVGENEKNGEAWYLLGLTQRAQVREPQARLSLKTASNLGHLRAKEALK